MNQDVAIAVQVCVAQLVVLVLMRLQRLHGFESCCWCWNNVARHPDGHGEASSTFCNLFLAACSVCTLSTCHDLGKLSPGDLWRFCILEFPPELIHICLLQRRGTVDVLPCIQQLHDICIPQGRAQAWAAQSIRDPLLPATVREYLLGDLRPHGHIVSMFRCHCFTTILAYSVGDSSCQWGASMTLNRGDGSLWLCPL